MIHDVAGDILLTGAQAIAHGIAAHVGAHFEGIVTILCIENKGGSETTSKRIIEANGSLGTPDADSQKYVRCTYARANPSTLRGTCTPHGSVESDRIPSF